jgi:hypothetical protein
MLFNLCIHLNKRLFALKITYTVLLLQWYIYFDHKLCPVSPVVYTSRSQAMSCYSSGIYISSTSYVLLLQWYIYIYFDHKLCPVTPVVYIFRSQAMSCYSSGIYISITSYVLFLQWYIYFDHKLWHFNGDYCYFSLFSYVNFLHCWWWKMKRMPMLWLPVSCGWSSAFQKLVGNLKKYYSIQHT